MPTVISRMKLDIQFEIGDSLTCFHTSGESNDEPTIITYNGREYYGTVELNRNDGEFTILVRIKDFDYITR